MGGCPPDDVAAGPVEMCELSELSELSTAPHGPVEMCELSPAPQRQVRTSISLVRPHLWRCERPD